MFKGLWQNMWPNIFAPSFWTLLGIFASHVLHRKTTDRKLNRQEDLLNTKTEGGLKEVIEEIKKVHHAVQEQATGEILVVKASKDSPEMV